ncbi:uncharacterized protein [Branchiostoma lanceolatum]|uniref:uncharacterized protein n=1 Tax=Branchiostoma lanceolatum TaxID=7740 RepID=UPI003453E283
MKNVVELPTTLENDVGFDSEFYNYIDSDDDDRQTGKPPVTAASNSADLRAHAVSGDGTGQQTTGGGRTSAANICGLIGTCKTKCRGSCMLRAVVIGVAVAALLGAGSCIIMYLTASTGDNLKNAETARQANLKTPPTAIKAWPVTTSAPPEVTLVMPEVAPAPAPPGVTPVLPQVQPTLQAVHENCRGDYKLVAGACVRLYNTWKSHDAAMTACKAEGATLAMPKTEELDVALRDLVKTEGNKAEHWIGMKDKDGTWYWVDDSLVGSNGYKGWSPGEPSAVRWLPLCGQYWSGGPTGYPMWDDDTCFLLKRFICQRRPSA